MSLSTLTAKGQTTIPIDIREYLQVQAGDRLEFIRQEGGAVLLVPATVDIASLEGVLPKPKKSVSLEDMQRAITRRGQP